MVSGGGEADAARRMETFKVPEVCKDELAVEEAEGVADDGDMVVVIKPANYFGVEL